MRQDEIKKRIGEDSVQQIMVKQEQALAGRSGSTLLVVDKSSGKLLSGRRLPVAPALDGMSAAGGRLYVATDDGRLCCLGASGQDLAALSDAEVANLNATAAPLSAAKGKGKGQSLDKGKVQRPGKGKQKEKPTGKES